MAIAEGRDGGVVIRPLSRRLISSERRRAVLEATDRAYALLQTDQHAWPTEQASRAAWDSLAAETLPAEVWSEDDFVAAPQRGEV